MLAFVSALALGAAACQPQQQQPAGRSTQPRANPNAAAAIKTFLDTEINGLSTLDRAGAGGRAQLVRHGRRALIRAWRSRSSPRPSPRTSMNSKVLAPAFTAITGIKVTHDLIGEGDVVEKLQTQMQSGENIYDAYVNDSDLIGTHWRYQQVRNLTDWMAGEGKDVTSPTLDLADFIGT